MNERVPTIQTLLRVAFQTACRMEESSRQTAAKLLEYSDDESVPGVVRDVVREHAYDLLRQDDDMNSLLRQVAAAKLSVFDALEPEEPAKRAKQEEETEEEEENAENPLADAEEFAERLRRNMKRKGVTSTQLAKRLNLHPNNVYQALAGSRNPQHRTVKRYADALDVRPTTLLPTYVG